MVSAHSPDQEAVSAQKPNQGGLANLILSDFLVKIKEQLKWHRFLKLTRKAYDDMFEASAIVESAITLLDILGGQSLSARDWSFATFGIGMLLRTANDVLNGGLDRTEAEEVV